MACGAGYRRDCTKKVCLARHIDDNKVMEDEQKKCATDEDRQIQIAIQRSLEDKLTCQFCNVAVDNKDDLIVHQLNKCKAIEQRVNEISVLEEKRRTGAKEDLVVAEIQEPHRKMYYTRRMKSQAVMVEELDEDLENVEANLRDEEMSFQQEDGKVIELPVTAALIPKSPKTPKSNEYLSWRNRRFMDESENQRKGSQNSHCGHLNDSLLGEATIGNGDNVSECIRDLREEVEQRKEQAENERTNKCKTENRLNSLKPVYGHGGDEGHCNTGLKNLGSTCYLNAIIQCLVNTDTFIQSLKMSEKLKLDQTGLGGELLFLSLVLKSGQCRYVSPNTFRHKLAESRQIFRGSEQQDAQEALLNILDMIESELITHKDGNEHLVEEIFDGKMTTDVKCTNCHKKSTKEDVFRYLQLEIPKSKNRSEIKLEDCIDKFLQSQLIDDKPCKDCENSMKAKKDIRISQVPEVLIIQLKRFSHDGRWQTKVHKNIHYPKQLDMGRYTGKNGDVYQLYSVVNHKGGCTAGHYTAICKDTIKDQWICYDDPNSYTYTWTEQQKASNGEGYILFYGKVKTKTTEVLKTGEERNDDLTTRPRRHKPSERYKENEELKWMRQDNKRKNEENILKKDENSDTTEQNLTQPGKKSDQKKKGKQTEREEVKEQSKCNKCDEPWGGFQIMCDECKEWYHGKCVGAKEGEYGPKDIFKCNPCWTTYTKTLERKISVIEKENEETTTKKAQTEKEMIKHEEKNRKRIPTLEEELTRKRNDIKLCKDEKDKLREENKERGRKIKELEIAKGKLEKENAETKTKQEKLTAQISRLEEDREKADVKQEKALAKLIEEIGNRERETKTINKINQQLKEEVRKLELNQLPNTHLCRKEEQKRDVATQSEDVELRTNENGGNGIDEIGLQTQRICTLENEVKERGKEITQKGKEIEELKGLVGEYRNRLENILGENSAKEREIDHLTDGLDTLKRTNIELVLQLDENDSRNNGAKQKQRREDGCDKKEDNNDMQEDKQQNRGRGSKE